MAASCLAADPPTATTSRVVSADNHQITLHYELPPVPPDCIIRIYPVPGGAFSKAPRDRTDWVDYFRSQGMVFPKGGFATYVPAHSILILANTEKQLRLVEPF